MRFSLLGQLLCRHGALVRIVTERAPRAQQTRLTVNAVLCSAFRQEELVVHEPAGVQTLLVLINGIELELREF